MPLSRPQGPQLAFGLDDNIELQVVVKLEAIEHARKPLGEAPFP